MTSRVLSRISRASGGLARRRMALLASLRQEQVQCISYGSHPLTDATATPPGKWVPSSISQLSRCMVFENSRSQRFGFSSTASPQSSGREPNQASGEQQTVEHCNSSNNYSQAEGGNESKETKDGSKAPAETESDTEDAELSIDDLVKLVAEKEAQLKLKHREMEKMKDKVLRSYAEMENVIGRTKREAENSKKFAIQNFAKSLLDVADNLGRASSVVKESFSKLDLSKDTAGAVPLLKTLLEGVEMTEKQLAEVFRKFGVEKFEPANEHFDPHRHHAVFQIPDASKPPGTVAVVLKPGYMLYDRVLRPAEVGVIQAVDDVNQNSEA